MLAFVLNNVVQSCEITNGHIYTRVCTLENVEVNIRANLAYIS